jgi:hypothetical protein
MTASLENQQMYIEIFIILAEFLILIAMGLIKLERIIFI